MKINWKVRLRKKTFWLTLVPAIILLAQIVGNWFGQDVAADLIGAEAAKFINATFGILTILGVVIDPTTAGMNDSTQALTYKTPKKDDQ